MTPSTPWPVSPTNGLRRASLAALLLGAVLAFSGCAALNSVSSEVSTFGSWPAGRAPGSFALERLPSQEPPDAQQAALERSAAAALQQAGFQPAAAGVAPDVTVQIGARISRQQRSPWDDPLWWRAWGPRGSSLALYQPGWGLAWQLERSGYLREVAVLIRDRASGQALYEARARTEGATAGSDSLLDAMFMASLKDFPQVQPQARTVSVPLR